MVDAPDCGRSDPSSGNAPSSIATGKEVSSRTTLLHESRSSLWRETEVSPPETSLPSTTAALAVMAATRTIGQLPPFNGRGDLAGNAARDWLARADDHFAASEAVFRISGAAADAQRVLIAANHLEGEARHWYAALPTRPATWEAFRTALLARFSSLPSMQIREQQLKALVGGLRAGRETASLAALQRFTTRFLQQASEIPASRMTEATKRLLYAEALPRRLAKVVIKADASDACEPLDKLAAKVLADATFDAYAAGSTGAVAAVAHARAPAATVPVDDDAMQLDAISLTEAVFQVSREEAELYQAESEGWTPFDTDQQPPAAAASRRPAAMDPLLQQLQATIAAQTAAINALSRTRGSGPGSGSGRKGAGESKKVPEQLAADRRAAHLCIRCGVAAYSPGASGHNSSTCKAAVDLTTPAAEGKKRAGF